MKDKVTGNLYDGNIRIQGEHLSFTVAPTQTGIFSPHGEIFILQPTTVNLYGHDFLGVSVYGYTTDDKSFILKNAVLVESYTEPTTTGSYEEKLYIMSTVTRFNSHTSLFNNFTTTLTNGDLWAIQVLAHYLNTSSVTTTSLTVQINFYGSEKGKVVLTGMIENALTDISSENIKNLNWEWFDV